ncbi:MAG TPA: hypothetical protein VEQ63_04145 [Bryobacteraceae bacterium]|nr:hypothetical protein [Bryobacteraceae bacterium]
MKRILTAPLMFLITAGLAMAQQPVLWRDPGAVEQLDFAGGPGGRRQAPKAPFRFIAVDTTGTQPKVRVSDANRRRWTVKFGEEVKAETFASRLAWAVGYFVEPVYFVRNGQILGIRDIGKAEKHITPKGYFRDARFELLQTSLGQFSKEHDWTWKKNPFLGSPELDGLKMMVMLTSNYDNKDARDEGSNTAIFTRGSGANQEWIFAVSDWGSTMGKWGNFLVWNRWDCEGYLDQSAGFVKGVEEGEVQFGFDGKHDDKFKDDITPDDVRWLMQYLGRVTDAQIRTGLEVSGATPAEVECYARAVRMRINQLAEVSRVETRTREITQ